MANITEVSEFMAAVPELATNTPALGGPGGVMNGQAQALANRTKYIKDVLDALGNSATLNVGTGAGDVAAGDAPAGAVTTHESTYAHANLPTAAGKTAADAIGAATGATTALKLANLASPASTTQQGVALLGASGGAVKLTKMPDGATAVYSRYDWTSGADGFAVGGGAISYPDTSRIRFTATGTADLYTNKPSGVALSAGKTIFIDFNVSKPKLVYLRSGIDGAGAIIGSFSAQPGFSIYKVQCRAGTYDGSLAVYPESGWASGDYFEIKKIWIGDYSYLTGSLSEEAVRISNELGDTAGVAVAASGTIAVAWADLVGGETITIGGKTYTMVTDTPDAEGEVKIDGSAATGNLRDAINASSPSAGRFYVTSANPLVKVTVEANPFTITAWDKINNVARTGIQGNFIAVSTSHSTRFTLSGATLSGGKDAVGAKIKTQLNAAIGAGAAVGAIPTKTATSILGYFAVADCASGAQVTLPAGGTWAWEVMTYGATYNSVKSGTAAGGAAITGTASANLCMRYERIA